MSVCVCAAGRHCRHWYDGEKCCVCRDPEVQPNTVGDSMRQLKIACLAAIPIIAHANKAIRESWAQLGRSLERQRQRRLARRRKQDRR